MFKHSNLSFLVSLLVLIAILGWQSGWQSVSSAATDSGTAFKGWLVDRMCEASLAHGKGSPVSALKLHQRDCALDPSCSEAGYALYTGGHFVDFDSKGNKLAHDFYEKTSQEAGHFVTVVGKMKGSLLSVDSIKEVLHPNL